MARHNIERRKQVEINTDPQRRCYNGCHAKSELQWAEWEAIDFGIPEEMIEQRLAYWRDLNDYAVSERGESARSEYRAAPCAEEE